jgi:hypothetical protein
MPNVIDEYLVKLGALVDVKGFKQFQGSLSGTVEAVKKFTEGSSADFTKVASRIVGYGVNLGNVVKVTGSAIASTAALGYAFYKLASQTAATDLNYQLFAMHMRLTAQSGKELKLITETLGADLPDIFWNPELKQRANMMKAALEAIHYGPNFEKDLRDVREMNFLLDLQKVTLEQYAQVAETRVIDAFNKMGIGPEQLIPKLIDIETWLLKNLPNALDSAGRWFSQFAGPARDTLGDIWRTVKNVGGAFRDAGVAFGQLAAAITGDKSFETLDGFIKNVIRGVIGFVDVVAKMADFITSVVRAVIQNLGTVAGGVDKLVHGDFKGAWADFKTATASAGRGVSDAFKRDVDLRTILGIGGAVGGRAVGGLAGGTLGAWGGGALASLLGPEATPIGAMIGRAAGTAIGQWVGTSVGGVGGTIEGQRLQDRGVNVPWAGRTSSGAATAPPGSAAGPSTASLPAPSGGLTGALAALPAGVWSAVQKVASATGIDARLILDQWTHETGNFTNRGARMLNNFAGVNMAGGKGEDYRKFASPDAFADYFIKLLESKRYADQGILGAKTIEDYAGALKRGGYYGASQAEYVGGMRAADRRYGDVDVGGITIVVHQNDADASQLQAAVKSGIEQGLGRQTQRNMQEFNTLNWSFGQ